MGSYLSNLMRQIEALNAGQILAQILIAMVLGFVVYLFLLSGARRNCLQQEIQCQSGRADRADDGRYDGDRQQRRSVIRHGRRAVDRAV